MGSMLARKVYPVIPKMDYPVRIVSAKADQPNTYPDGDDVKLLKVEVEILEGPYKGTKARKSFTQIISQQSHLNSFMVALGIPELQENQTVDAAQLAALFVNRYLIATIETKQSQKGTFYNMVGWRQWQVAPGTSIAPAPAPAYIPPPPPVPSAIPGVVATAAPMPVPPPMAPPSAPPQHPPAAPVTGALPHF